MSSHLCPRCQTCHSQALLCSEAAAQRIRPDVLASPDFDRLRQLRSSLDDEEWTLLCRHYVDCLLDGSATSVRVSDEGYRLINRIDFVPADPNRTRAGR